MTAAARFFADARLQLAVPAEHKHLLEQGYRDKFATVLQERFPGVRVNLRPLMTARPFGARARTACILRVSPGVRWGRDKGNESRREKESFPWLWGWDGQSLDFTGGKDFDGVRWNDLHYTRAAKLAVGGWFGTGAVTVTCWVEVPVALSSSVTVNVTV